MGNIIDYIKWRGDFSFHERVFNSVDNLILSALSYIKYEDFIGEMPQGTELSISGVCEKYKSVYQEELPVLLKALAESRRFENMRFCDFEAVTEDGDEQIQFAALHLKMEEELEYISFRGTDSSIVGWQEDFSMSFQIVAAQKYAAEYLTNVLRNTAGEVMVGGHSKGGNLAVYSVGMLSDKDFEKVSRIYSNDGPGLCPDIMNSFDYKKVKGKLTKIVPNFSIIGMLFEEDPDIIVSSSVDGILAHEPLTWQVEGSQFVRCDSLAEKCQHYNEIFDDWINDVEVDQRQIFVSDFFSALKVKNSKYFEELSAGGAENFEDVLFSFGRSKPSSKIVIGKLVKSFVKGILKIDVLELLRTKQMLWSIGILLVGIIFVCFPSIAAKLVGTAFFLWLLFYSVIRLYRFYKDYMAHIPIDKYKVLFFSSVAGIEILCIIKNSIIQISVNMILGGGFLWRAWTRMKKVAKYKAYHKRRWILYLLDTILTGLLGIVAIATSNQGSAIYMISAGSYLILYGFSSALKVLYDNMQN